MAIDITNANFTTEVIKSDKPVVIDVYATWCGPCKQMAPLFEELSKEMGSTYKFAKLNIDEERDIAVQHNVSSIPTFLFFKNGKVVGKETGYMGKDILQEKIEDLLG